MIKANLQVLQALLELILPDRCRVCGVGLEDGGGICSDCLSSVRYINRPGCSRCGEQFRSPAADGHLCSGCLQRPPPFVRAVSLTWYEDPVRELLHRLKYRADTRVVPALASIARHAGTDWFGRFDCLIPVPLHRRRLCGRGLNQSLELARLLSAHCPCPIHVSLLIRVRNTASQTGLDRSLRRKNLKNAFKVTSPGLVSGKIVCLVDDVFTTGTTAAECSRVLMDAGAKEVHVFTFARVLKFFG